MGTLLEKASVEWKRRIQKRLDESREQIKCVFAVTFLTGILSYYLFVVFGYSGPDGLCEGLYYYTNADWHLACGRWAVRYLNLLIGHNVVMPLLIVLLYCLCIAVAVLLVASMLRIDRRSHLILVSAVMTASPSIIAQYMVPHVTLTFAFAFLLAILYCWCVRQNHVWADIAGILCMTVSLGLYQSYVGAAAMLFLLILVRDLIEGDSLSVVFKRLAKYLATGIIAGVADMMVIKMEVRLRGGYIADKVGALSLKQILLSLEETVPDAYKVFFQYFQDGMLGRKYFYGVILAVGICCLIFCLCGMLKERKYMRAFVCIVFMFLIPAGANAVGVLLPGNNITWRMMYHFVLIVPLCFSLLERVKSAGIYFKMIRLAVCVCTTIIVSSYVLSANATLESLRVSYSAIDTQTKLILADVYDLDGYQPNETRIVFAGFPDDHIVRSSLGIYDFVIALPDNVAYWNGMLGLNHCRRSYLLNYCGIEAGYINPDEYKAVIESAEFQNMPVWPGKGSVKMIDGMAVVKISETPPTP